MPRRSDRPRIYHVAPRRHAALATSPQALAWKEVIARAEDLGFDHLLCAPLWTAPAEDVFAAADPAAADPLYGAGSTDAVVEMLAEACARGALSLWLDISLGQAAVGGELLARHPAWFSAQPPQTSVLDPRRDPHERIAAALALQDGRAPAGFLNYWRQRLGAMARAGASGFRVIAPHQLPSVDWRELTEAVRADHPDIRFTAWTPGLSAQHVHALQGAGFDAVYSSLPWWNLRDDWYVDEHARLSAAAPRVIAPAAAPDDLHPGAAAAVVRALRCGAELADGVLLPMLADPGLRGDDAASSAIARANLGLARREPGRVQALRRLTADATPVTLIQRKDVTGDTLVAINTSLDDVATLDWNLARSRLAEAVPDSRGARENHLPPGGVLSVGLAPAKPVVTLRRKAASSRQRETLAAAMRLPRVAIQDVTPTTADPSHLIKRVVGEPLEISANIFMDGHDVLAARVLWRAADEDDWRAEPMTPLGNDAWQASLVPQRVGRHEFTIEAWRDVFGTYRSELEKKHAAGLDVSLEVKEGRQLLARAGIPDTDKLEAGDLLGEDIAAAMRRADVREFSTRWSAVQALGVERRAACFASWYEMFPRSQSGDPARHGTFRDVIARLPYVRDMGFDVLYFPPIHPIGMKNRKGRNNSLTPAPGDPGSPYATGSPDGGHDALHPELGSLEDFRDLVRAAADHGLEIAMDFAIQCSPDHPWLREHPEWFAWRADGSLRYAENPPKKYEDIVNVDFYGPPGKRKGEGSSALWLALRDVVLFWCEQGVRTFRVDNPHTKPLPFWQWMIDEVQARYPDAIFLSEAFTRPNMMYRLAAIGFSQSYTYFTWRNTKAEMTAYLEEVGNPPVADIFRPHFFVNTPDINPRFLQSSGRPGFLIRAALATTMSGLWGMYNGFELCEGTPVPGKEEYLDSEKYEIRAWDWDRPGNIRAEIAQLNRIRRANPALHSHRGIAFHPAANDEVLFYSKRTPEGDNVLLIAVSMDPFHAHTATLDVPLWSLGLPDDATVHLEDLLHEHRFEWHGKHQTVHLTPDAPYAIWRVRRQP